MKYRAVIAVALCGIVLTAGCTRDPKKSVTQLFDHVPALHWGSEPPKLPEPPTVSANVARSTQPEPAEVVVATEQAEGDQAAASTVEHVADVTPPLSFAADDAPPEAAHDERIRELKAALSADTDQLLEPSASSSPHPMRLRVDGLLQRARGFLDIGQLKEARRTAQMAAELSNSVALEFLPTDDRPHDVLREIEVRLESATTPDEQREAEAAAVQPLSPASSVRRPSEAERETPPSPRLASAVANVPRTLFPPKVATLTIEPSAEDSGGITIAETALAPSLPPTAGERTLSEMLSEDVPWGPKLLESTVEPIAPQPSSINAIEPLPSFRGSPETTSTAAESVVAQPRRELLAWTDWLALGVLLGVLGIVGLLLSIRYWRWG